MRFLHVVLAAVLLSACASSTPPPAVTLVNDGPVADSDNPFYHMLTREEKVIHHCLQAASTHDARAVCLKGTPYEASFARTPASGGNARGRQSGSDDREEIFERNRPVFNARAFVGLMNLLQRLNREAGRLVDSKGVGVFGSAVFGAGVDYDIELALHHGSLGLFCAPGVTAQTDIGVEAGISLLNVLSCRDHHAYEGGFLGISAGASLEGIGLPGAAAVGYAFGINLQDMVNAFRTARRQGMSSEALVREMNAYAAIASRPATQAALNAAPLGAVLFNQGLFILAAMDPSVRRAHFRATQAFNRAVFQHVLRDQRSLGLRFKEFAANRRVATFLEQNRFTNIQRFLGILAANMTGCDSLGGAVSLSATLSPVDVGVSYSNYALLLEIEPADLAVLQVASPLAILNPFLFNRENLLRFITVATRLGQLPGIAARSCGMERVANIRF